MGNECLTVLIVDDDKDDAMWLSEVIGDIIENCSFRFEQDGIAAIRFIKEFPAPRLVFLDLNMPLKNGLDCLRDIYNLDLLPDTSIIIYSTSNNMKDIDQAYKYGAVCYIVKPTCTKQLKVLVSKALLIAEGSNSRRVTKTNFVLMEGLMNDNC